MEKPRILVIDDEDIIRQLLLRIFDKQGYYIETIDDGNAALKKISEGFFNLLITDLKMPKINGMDVLKEIKKINPYIEVIIITGYPTIESAVEAIKIGAFDFVCKPFDLHQIISTVNRCLQRQKLNIGHIEVGELSAFIDINKTITTYDDFGVLLNQILESALKIVKARKGSLLLFDEISKDLCVKASRGLSQEGILNTKIKTGDGAAGAAAREENPVSVTDIGKDPDSRVNTGLLYETKSFLSIPLMSKNLCPQGDILGVLNITEKISGEEFTERDQLLLSVFSVQAAAVIENYKLYSQLQEKIGVLERSIKELEDTRNQLIQTEKLAAVGHLAFGIAHEIRNPLGIILEGVEFVQSSIGKENKVTEESIARIKRSIDRANNIIVDLLKFSRASKIQMESVYVHKIMEEVVSLIQNQARLNSVQIDRGYQEKDINIRVKADPNMLRQAIFNLCINAIDAMSGGGRLSLNIQASHYAGKNKVLIEVLDTGEGISSDMLPKIFTPFFTTKEPGKGTGLGLSIVRLIIERHDGVIDVESKVNEGTKFTIRLAEEKD